MKYNFSDKELKQILKELIIIVDTREKGNKNIINWFEKNKIKYKIQKLDHGDYSAYLEKGSIKGIDRDLYFNNDIVIEKKASIDELAGNFSSKDNPRFKSEFAFLNKYNTRVYIFLEDNLFDKHLRNGNYRSLYDNKTLYARIKGHEAEFNTIIRPVSSEYIASEIYNTLYYYVRNVLKRDFYLEKFLK